MNLPDLSNTDALMWFVEDDPMLRSTILGVLPLLGTPSWDRVVERVEQLTFDLPVLRSRVVRSTVNPGHLHWEPVPDVDLDYHLRRLAVPAGGTLDDVVDLARTTSMAGLDRSRPLWEFALVEGLAGGRSALVTKVHHVLTDGVGAVQLAAHLFDFEPDPPARPHHEPGLAHVAPPDPVVRVAGDVIHELGAMTDAVVHQLGTTLPAFLRNAIHPRRAVQDGMELARSIGRTVAPSLTTLSPVMTHRSTASSFHLLDVSLAELRRGAKQAGGTLNDGFLAGIAGGLRRYHEHHGATVGELRVAMPISLRSQDDAAGGNHVTVLRFLVPVGIEDPVERVRAMSAVGKERRNEASLPFTDSVAGVLNLLPSAVIGSMMKHVDFLASNVPGTPIPLYLAGVEVERFFPFGPTAGSAVNVTLMSYCDRCCIGINCDRAAIPDGDGFAEHLRAGFAEVIALGA